MIIWTKKPFFVLATNSSLHRSVILWKPKTITNKQKEDSIPLLATIDLGVIENSKNAFTIRIIKNYMVAKQES